MEKIFSCQSMVGDIVLEPDSMLLIKISAVEHNDVIKRLTALGAKFCITGVHDLVTALVFTERELSLSFPKEMPHIVLALHPLCEIMAFLDESQQVPVTNKDKQLLLNIDIVSHDELAYWFICCCLMGNACVFFSDLLNCIRKQESYFLTRYLIKNRCSNHKVNNLCQSYGLSYSYFRKISKKYLGVSAKAKMSQWRLAQTILDLLESNSSITEIALKNGYSSSAHVCSTFTSVIGISPYAIRKLNGK